MGAISTERLCHLGLCHVVRSRVGGLICPFFYVVHRLFLLAALLSLALQGALYSGF